MNVYVRELSKQLAARGHTVDIFTRGFPQEDALLAEGVRVISIPAGDPSVHSIGSLPDFIQEFAHGILALAAAQGVDYELIHANYWMSGLAAISLKEAWDSPIILMFHTLGLVKNRIAALGIRESDERIRGERAAMAAADHVVAATPAERADLQWLYELHSDKVSVIPPGVDLALFRPISKAAARQRLSIPMDKKLVLFVGRIEALKGIDTLVRAMHLIDSDGWLRTNGLEAMIIGGDVNEDIRELNGEMTRLRQLVNELRLTDRVTFLGSRAQEDLSNYYASADAVVMPSYSESFGMVALEAMATARPVIASRVGGLAYLIKDGENGFHVQEGNAQQLADRLLEILSNSQQAEALGLAARKHAEAYSWVENSRRIEELYSRFAA
jgi:D-inositol-3-phosphate glycosyltransferase